jgi:glyoxylase-like metal-dependent hydrolase (beta-lactamase superfamily II)
MNPEVIKRNNLTVYCWTLGPFHENTYLITNESGIGTLLDPGMSNTSEENAIFNFVQEHNIEIDQIVNTHCHIDHILGNNFAKQKWNVPLLYHILEESNIKRSIQMSSLWGIPYTPSPQADSYIDESSSVQLASCEVVTWLVPGHCQGHLAFIHHASQSIFSGDVLFRESIGRVDLPGGNADEIEQSILRLYTLPEDYVVFSGHGPLTTIGHEKKNNPFVKG